MKIFKEKQRFTQTWLIVLLASNAVISFMLITKEYTSQKMALEEYIMTLLLVTGSICLIFVFQLKTRIDEYGIHYQFFPFHLKMKKILWEEITTIEVKKYDPITEYGGWGLKGSMPWKKKKKRAYTVSGYVGIYIELKNKNTILIGTKEKEKVKQVVGNYKNKLK